MLELMGGVKFARYYQHWMNGFIGRPNAANPYSASRSAAMIRNAIAETSRFGVPIFARAPGNESKYRTDLHFALGAFLLVAGPGSSFGYGDCW
jgi:hypothetical protein